MGFCLLFEWNLLRILFIWCLKSLRKLGGFFWNSLIFFYIFYVKVYEGEREDLLCIYVMNRNNNVNYLMC